MPYVNIKVTDENVTKEQKQALIKGATQLLVDVLNKNPETTFVVIDEVSTDNWGIGYDQVTKIRQLADAWEVAGICNYSGNSVVYTETLLPMTLVIYGYM